MISYNPTFLKVLRTARFKSQGEAAETLGLSRAWYSLVEQGRLQPTEDIAQKLESVFGLPASDLLKSVSVEKLVEAGV